ncbi:hypothetical protein [Polaromonas sp. JS666]|uniref:hypothetical protein n=1 Tax=Polaromonas sp. (strain JS666 / ATCC BAA-500) TaxID=296591 RepID=UPI0000532CC0|nr:hypothetical protein [Polaromonas sp. JS666]ABE47278.1 hypothetical protein Bpro_5424 [Polaromonas sp. JS666]
MTGDIGLDVAADPGVLSAASAADPVVAPLNRHQVKRLRFYFQQGRHSLSYTPDSIDLDLIALKTIVLEATGSGYTKIKITELGLATLHQRRQNDLSVRQVHHDLGGRVAEYLREQGRITWENIQFKNLMASEDLKTSGGEPYQFWKHVRPDVFSIAPTLDMKTANPCVHEVKVSRADFLSDKAKPEKRQAYAMLAQAVYYVAPEGMIQLHELPKEVGLLVEVKAGQFTLVKRARKNKMTLQPHHFLNLIVKPGQYPENYGI